MSDLNPDQLRKLEDLGATIKSNFKTLDEAEIISRLMLTGRDCANAITGYKFLRRYGVISQEFITPGTDGVLLGMIARNPNVALLIDRLECTSMKIKVTGPAGPPPLIRTLAEIRGGLNLKTDF